jgi:DNA-binding NarL/FixJ family response regulator
LKALRVVSGERGTAQAVFGERQRILIVEDDYIVASELANALDDAGFEVSGIANTADEALRLARASRPTLAVVDIRLFGRRDGIEAAVELARFDEIRSIFATAHNDAGTRARAQAANPLGWLRKPYTMEAAVAAVKAALAQLG